VVVEWLSNNALNPVRTPASRRLLKKRKRLAAGRARVSAHVGQTRTPDGTFSVSEQQRRELRSKNGSGAAAASAAASVG
jgi:hypothetical protein